MDPELTRRFELLFQLGNDLRQDQESVIIAWMTSVESVLAGLLFAMSTKDSVDHPINILDTLEAGIPDGADDVGASTIRGLCARIRERVDSFG